MPVPKRWHPISRDLNQDPEVWELTSTYSERSLRIWLEILAGADKTENQIPLSGLWLSSLAQITRVNLKTVVQVVVWMIDRGWITVQGDPVTVTRWIERLHELCQNWPKTRRKQAEDLPETSRRWPGDSPENGRKLVLSISNYWKYRKRREPKGADNGSPPSLSVSSLPNNKKEEEKMAGLASPSPANGTLKQRSQRIADESFITELKSNPAYAGIDIEREINKCRAWLLTPKGQGKKLTRGRLVNWLNRIDTPLNGHRQSPTCSKRVHVPGDQRLRECGQPASPMSRPIEPRCAEHLTPARHPGATKQ